MRPLLELLEDRVTPSTWIVSNDNDSGVGSLRDAINSADASGTNSTIVFDPTVDNGAGAGIYNIVLTSGPLDITVPMSVNANLGTVANPGSSRVDINGNNDQIFVIPAGFSVAVNFIGDPTGDPSNPASHAFILENGYASIANNGDVSNNGGAIDGEDPNVSIALFNMEIISNRADGNGGGVYSAGSLGVYGTDLTATLGAPPISVNPSLGPTAGGSLDSSYIEGNVADASGTGGCGGGLWAGRQMIIDQTDVLDNIADNGGGAYEASNSSEIRVNLSLFQDNVANANGGNGGGVDAKYNIFIASSTFGGFDQNGQPAGNTATGSGAAAYSYDGMVLVDTGAPHTFNAGDFSIFQFNEAQINGGAIWAYSNIMVGPGDAGGADYFSQNVAGQNGGALYSVRGPISVEATALFGNTATLGQGGAIWSGGNVNVADGSFVGDVGFDPLAGGAPYKAGNFAKGDGGGVWAAHNVSVLSSNVIGNTTKGNGGGIADYTWTVVLTNSVVAFNTANLNGAGVYSISGEIDVIGDPTLIVHCTANGDGGGLFEGSGAINIFSDTLIAANQAKDGGGIYIGSGGTLFADGSQGPATPDSQFDSTFGPLNLPTSFGVEIAYNKSTAPSTLGNGVGGGGGVDAQGSHQVTLLYVLFEGNTAASDGGGMLERNVSSTQISYCTFEANVSVSGTSGGGAVAAFGTLQNSLSADDDTFSENGAKTHGGALLLSGIDAFINHCTFTDNFVTGSSGVSGRDLYGANFAKVYIENDLFADFNLSGTAAAVSEIGAQHTYTSGKNKGKFVEIISMGHNLTTDNSLAKVTNYNVQNGDIASGHQLLCAKAINGNGKTPTYALEPGGQAIGGGDTQSSQDAIDQDGNSRPINGNPSSIGATETICAS